MFRRLSNRHGFSLLELGIAILIAGLIVGSLWVLVSNAQEKSRKAKLSAQIVQIISQTKNVFGNSTDLWALTGDLTPEAITAGIFPADMQTNGTIRHAFSGAAQLGMASGIAGTPAGKSFSLSMFGIRHDVCSDVLMKLVATTQSRRQLRIVGYLYAPNGGTAIVYPGNNELTAGDLIRYCSAVPEAPSNVLAIYFLN